MSFLVPPPRPSTLIVIALLLLVQPQLQAEGKTPPEVPFLFSFLRKRDWCESDSQDEELAMGRR